MTDPSIAPGDEGGRTLAEKMFAGTLWMFAMRWGARLLSIINIAVLARLLEREDFGIAAMAAAVVALPTALLELGLEAAIIREHRPTAAIYNTAWTIRVLQLTVVAAGIYLIAPWAADYYGDARITEVLQVLSIAVLLRGLENVWTVSFRKEMNFRRDFIYELICRFAGVALAIALAFALRSYWALIYGQIATAGARLVLSLIMAPQRPRPTLSHWRHIWSFSQWSLLKGFAAYIINESDKLILGRLATPADVGSFTVGREIAAMPLSEIAGPMNRSLGPGFSEMQHQQGRLTVALAKSLSAIATLAVPLSLGLALTAYEIVVVLLGEAWLQTAPILQILGILGAFTTLRLTLDNFLTVTGHIRSATLLTWSRAVAVVVMAIPMTMHYGPQGTAAAFGLSALFSFALTLHVCHRHLPKFTPILVARAVARPVIAGAVMGAVVLAVAASGLAQPHLLLAAEVIAGAVTYGGVLYLVWRLAGRPDGIESELLARLRRRVARRA